MRQIEVTVRRDHIDRGTFASASGCPVALAIAEALGVDHRRLAVLTDYKRGIGTVKLFRSRGKTEEWSVDLPAVANEWAGDFDEFYTRRRREPNRAPTQPFVFTLEVPE